MGETKKVYSVNIKKTEYGSIDVEAENRGEALDMALAEYKAGHIKWFKEDYDMGTADPI